MGELAKYSKAFVPIVGAILTAGAKAIGIAPELITPEVVTAVIGISLVYAGAVFGVKNKD